MKLDVMRIVAEFASLAPSVHNTQPWRFVGSEDTLDVHADPDRQLRYLDPSGRQLYLSCGAAVEFARLAVRGVGYSCKVELLPDETDRTLVARLRVTGRAETTDEERELIEAAARRYTDRGPYSDDALTREELDRLRQAAGAAGCWLRVLDRHDERITAITLLAHAERLESADPEYLAELEQWHRTVAGSDGLPEAAYNAWPDAGRVSDVPLRDFSGHDRHPVPDNGPPPAVERDTIVIIGTDVDSERSWLDAGRGTARLLLTLTAANLVSQPLGPVLDVPATRARLRREIGLLGQPQLMIRVGHGTGRPHTHRRSVDDTFSLACSC